MQVVVDALRKYRPRFVVAEPVRQPAYMLFFGLKLTLVQFIGSTHETGVFYTQLLPLTTVLTSSIPEAVQLLNKAEALYQSDIRSLDDLVNLAKALHSLGPGYVLLRGTHLPLTRNFEVPRYDIDKEVIVDVVYNGTDVSLIKTAYINTEFLRGAGSVFACMFLTPEAAVFPE